MTLHSIVKQAAVNTTRTTSKLRLRKAPLILVMIYVIYHILLFLTPAAVQRLKYMTKEDDPQFLRVGVKTKGCSGNSYMLEFTKRKDKFDEVVDQDGVTVLVDSKALLTVLGSEMDYVEDKLSSQFVFNNPNVKGTCGCGESFVV